MTNKNNKNNKNNNFYFNSLNPNINSHKDNIQDNIDGGNVSHVMLQVLLKI